MHMPLCGARPSRCRSTIRTIDAQLERNRQTRKAIPPLLVKYSVDGVNKLTARGGGQSRKETRETERAWPRLHVHPRPSLARLSFQIDQFLKHFIRGRDHS